VTTLKRRWYLAKATHSFDLRPIVARCASSQHANILLALAVHQGRIGRRLPISISDLSLGNCSSQEWDRSQSHFPSCEFQNALLTKSRLSTVLIGNFP
jgi:hypothetical protein